YASYEQTYVGVSVLGASGSTSEISDNYLYKISQDVAGPAYAMRVSSPSVSIHDNNLWYSDGPMTLEPGARSTQVSDNMSAFCHEGFSPSCTTGVIDNSGGSSGNNVHDNSAWQSPDGSVIGTIDGVYTSGATTYVYGWACAKTVVSSIPVHVYLNGPAGVGTYGGSFKANVTSETAVNQA